MALIEVKGFRCETPVSWSLGNSSRQETIENIEVVSRR